MNFSPANVLMAFCWTPRLSRTSSGFGSAGGLHTPRYSSDKEIVCPASSI
jgi:hypothetical protein